MRFLKAKLLLLVFLFSCAHKPTPLTSELKTGLVSALYLQQSQDLVHPTMKVQRQQNFWLLTGGADVLQNTTQATVSVVFRTPQIPHEPQDLIALSVGNPGPTYASRFSIRIQASQLMGILRADDQETPQEIFSTGVALKPNTWHRVTMTVDYETNQAALYIDGHKLETKGQLKFTKKMTSDTPSASMSLGAEDDGSKHFFQGEIREVLIWRRVLGWKEITKL